MKSLNMWFMFVLIYISIYFNYIYENENIRNITNTFLWLYVIIIVLVTLITLSKEVKIEKSDKPLYYKIIGRVLFFIVPLVFLYYGDMVKGVVLLVSQITLYGRVKQLQELQKKKN